MDEQTWNAWKRDWEWVVSGMKRKAQRAANKFELVVEDLEIAPPVPFERVRELEWDQGLVRT